MFAPATIEQLLSGRLLSKTFILQPVGNGSINDCYRINLEDESFFCKVSPASTFSGLFQKEKAGLELIAEQGVIKTPLVINCFEENDHQFLLLEWIEPGERTHDFWKTFGKNLATLHQITSERFGLGEDNYTGSVPQSNQHHQTWIDFFARQRLRPMMKKCFDKRLLSKEHRHEFERLEQKLSTFFTEENPSLLHGDLWNGNFLCNQKSEPVLVDPAVYYGHRSMDLAMTTLFGGFDPAFYEAYNHHHPLPENYKEQWAVCNLYPLLIHLYLFGTSYLPQIERTLRRFV